VRDVTDTLPQGARDLLDRPEFATIATIDPDGQPQLSVVWVARDGDDLLVSTIRGRRKTANLVRDARATVLVYPAADPYRYLEVRGTVQLVDDPHADLIHELSVKYTGQRFDGVLDQRVVVRLTPTKVVWYA
jgi:PPOX class probable F420-dependent enzyme